MFATASDRQLRKRAFYSLYTMDRLLSAEFGIPIMLSDSDIDTCLPGDYEKHDDGEAEAVHPARTPVDETTVQIQGRETAKRKRVDNDDNGDALPAISTTGSQSSGIERTVTKKVPPLSSVSDVDSAARVRLLAANALIRMASMVGRAMELFNKSLKHRSLEREFRKTQVPLFTSSTRGSQATRGSG